MEDDFTQFIKRYYDKFRDSRSTKIKEDLPNIDLTGFLKACFASSTPIMYSK